MDDEQQSIFAMQQDWRFYSANQFSTRLPTIAPREEQILHHAYHNYTLSSIADLPRTRLPPRSRSGCWTCRMRKVKCDEGRPRCNQCTRLNHECDYSPKLAFKNETPKVVDKYLGPNSPLDDWDPTAALDANRDFINGEDDHDLPAFNLLTSEEDWQKKAESQPPGTYFVVANSESFADLDEYRVASPVSGGISNFKHRKTPSNTFVDEGTVILGIFEDPPSKPIWKPADAGSVRSDSSAPTDITFRPGQLLAGEVGSLIDGLFPVTAFTQQDLEFSEPNLRLHYRLFVRRYIFRIPQDVAIACVDSEDLFEQEAAFCAPLHYALMALSALSLGCRNNYKTLHALQHYENSIKSLKNLQNEQQLASNGLFLTHFILLIYEIAATEEFWYNHLESLRQIMQQRREMLPSEPFAGVVWWICLIDCIALLSRSGKGELVLDKVHSSSVPASTDLRMTRPFLLNDPTQMEEWELLAPTFDFLREITIQAARIGEICGQIRDTFRSQTLPPTRVQIAQSQQKASQARETLTQRWKKQLPTPLAAALGHKRLSGRARDAYEHASLTYNACVIYTHTSMWRTQRLDTEPTHYTSDIASAIRNILRLANDLVSRQNLEQRFAVFALLMAGMASTEEDDKKKALELIRAFERESVGNNTRATRKFLEEIYAKQSDSVKRKGHALDIDWIEMGEAMGQRIINFGL